MIITRTPLRVSFAGGGTDLRSFYKEDYGAVVSTAINMYVYVSIHKFFSNDILLKYSKTEQVKRVEDIQHPLIREAMKLVGVTKGVEITVTSDIPAGSGLATSSAFTVGLLHALYAYRGMHVSAERLAKEACHIEINLCGSPIGKQDQYAAAYGGFNWIKFHKDETVQVNPLFFRGKKQLERNLLLFHTGTRRSANTILSEQSKITPESSEEKFIRLRKMRDQTDKVVESLEAGNFANIAKMLHEGWALKKSLVSSISNSDIDEMYETALNAGAQGGKISGAGGGGFLFVYCEPEKQDAVRQALIKFKEVPFSFDTQGSKVIYVDER